MGKVSNKETFQEEKKANEAMQPPTEEEFELPTNEEQFESMVDRFATIGLKRVDLEKVLETSSEEVGKLYESDEER